MVKLKSLYLGIVLLMLITACQPQSAQVADLPTLAGFPTNTETPLPSDTPEESDTPTETDTPLPTLTPTSTYTSTYTPTATWTRPPSATPTNTQTFTPSPSPTPEATITPIPTRTPNTPVIETFQSTVTNANNGDPVTLRWVVQADSARLETIDSNGNITLQQNVNLIGTYSTNTPATGNVVTYRLTAIRGTDEVRSIITVDMVQNCTTPWYFTYPPTTAGCPTTPALSVQVVFQQFNSGFMFRANVAGQSRVCGVQFDRNLYSCFAAQTYSGTPPVTPVPGKFAPNSSFEHSYYNDLATGGFWYSIIGWGNDTGSTISVQTQTGEDGLTYYEFPNGIYPFVSNLTATGASTNRVTAP